MTSVPHSGAKSVTPGGSVAGGHTAGEWFVAETVADDEDFPEVVVRAGALVVAVAIGGLPNGHQDSNARLIAAAPELLEAALLAEGILGNDLLREQMSGDGDYQALTAAVAQLQKAIAKATAGETRNAEGAL